MGFNRSNSRNSSSTVGSKKATVSRSTDVPPPVPTRNPKRDSKASMGSNGDHKPFSSKPAASPTTTVTPAIPAKNPKRYNKNSLATVAHSKPLPPMPVPSLSSLFRNEVPSGPSREHSRKAPAPGGDAKPLSCHIIPIIGPIVARIESPRYDINVLGDVYRSPNSTPAPASDKAARRQSIRHVTSLDTFDSTGSDSVISGDEIELARLLNRCQSPLNLITDDTRDWVSTSSNVAVVNHPLRRIRSADMLAKRYQDDIGVLYPEEGERAGTPGGKQRRAKEEMNREDETTTTSASGSKRSRFGERFDIDGPGALRKGEENPEGCPKDLAEGQGKEKKRGGGKTTAKNEKSQGRLVQRCWRRMGVVKKKAVTRLGRAMRKMRF